MKNAQRLADRIKSFGYRVFAVEDRDYGYYSDGTRIAYFDWGFYGFHISSVNAPGSFGSGYRIADLDSAEAADKALLEEALATVRPTWAERSKKVLKYKNLDDYLSKYWQKDKLVEL